MKLARWRKPFFARHQASALGDDAAFAARPHKKKSAAKEQRATAAEPQPRTPAARRRPHSAREAQLEDEAESSASSSGSDSYPVESDPFHLDLQPRALELPYAPRAAEARGDEDQDQDQDEPPRRVAASIARYLTDYQKDGVLWFHQQYTSGLGGLLCDDMGVGKTPQSVAFISALLGVTGRRRADGGVATRDSLLGCRLKC